MAVRLLSMAATRRGEAGPRCQKNAQNLWRVSVVSMFMLSVVMLRETAENGCDVSVAGIYTRHKDPRNCDSPLSSHCEFA